jgi:ketosteroid isomerase-like protein
MKRADIERWLDDYVQAWKSYDREAIAALFSDDVEYRYHPNDEPLRGRDAVIASWLGEGADDNDRDAPGTFEVEYRPVAVDGDIAVATGTSSYREEPNGEIVRVYDNCFVMRFDDRGRCREFTEWYVKRPAP